MVGFWQCKGLGKQTFDSQVSLKACGLSRRSRPLTERSGRLEPTLPGCTLLPPRRDDVDLRLARCRPLFLASVTVCLLLLMWFVLA